MDLGRVGIVGGSWGGYWAARGLLCHGDFFSVAVAASGNHDPWRDNAWFTERYLGLPDTNRRPEHSNATFAERLEGHLLLVQGELESHHCHPAYTLELVRALIRADKDVDLLVVPDADHQASCGDHPYVARRTWDHLVTHLLGDAPPQGYRVARPTTHDDRG
jgi:dipeptidyl aminopeptidase/acylaminoacyl peptidase